MRCPSLAELPPPPPDRTGWPWTEESPPIAGTQPRLTLITPSYMQGEFIEQTIRSVLLQGYPDLEYFILDGGSTDGTRKIIRKYEPWLAGWRCEKDAGQSAAINEGWGRATGEVLGWINSDDWYHPGALAAVGRRFAAEPSVTWVSGAVDDVDGAGVFKNDIPRHPHPGQHAGAQRFWLSPAGHVLAEGAGGKGRAVGREAELRVRLRLLGEKPARGI